MDKQEFLRKIQNRLANGATGSSALRNQGAAGVARVAREFLSRLDLGPLGKVPPGRYTKTLDTWTKRLRRKLPQGAQNWGTARKALNLFLVEVFFNRFLGQKHRMDRLKDALETPLDSQAREKIAGFARERGLSLPKCPTIRGLTEQVSRQYQEAASQMAAGNHIPRACLDLILWRRGTKET